MHNNGLVGDLFGGIYATRVANYLGIPPHEDDRELPPFLDYDAMERFQFLERGDLAFQYKIIFDRQRVFRITLLAPAFFDFQVK